MSLRETLSYPTSRERFRQQAEEHGWQLVALEPPSSPLEGAASPDETSDDSIDVACRGPEDAPRTLVVTAGLHGVEGYFGSRLLLDWLRAAERPAAGSSASPLRLVAVHCLNPFGYIHRRRTNAQNIDLNRNFMLRGERYTDGPRFDAELDALMHPIEPPTWSDFVRLRLLWMAARRGPKRVQQAIAGGQAGNPRGLFFGGLSPSPFVAWCEQHWPRIVLPPGGVPQGSGHQITHFDLHSGLGAFGSLKLLLQPGIDPAGIEWMRNRFGGAMVVPPPQADTRPTRAASDLPYQARGTWGRWLQNRFHQARYRYACAEFGTYSALHVLAALREENFAWHHDGAGSGEHERAANRLRDTFDPPSTRWRATVRAKFLSLITTAAHSAADDVQTNKS